MVSVLISMRKSESGVGVRSFLPSLSPVFAAPVAPFLWLPLVPSVFVLVVPFALVPTSPPHLLLHHLLPEPIHLTFVGFLFNK